MSNFRSVVAVTLTFFTPALPGGEPVTRDEVFQEFQKLMPADVVSNARTFSTNGFSIESSVAKELSMDRDQDGKLTPSGKEMKVLMVSAPETFRVGIERGREGMSLGGGVAIFHRDGPPMLSAGDRDGDGRLDVLDYTVFDSNGKELLLVTDYEADGQADFRLHYQEKFFEIWHADRWHRVEIRGEQRGITVNGKFVELKRENNRWVVPPGK